MKSFLLIIQTCTHMISRRSNSISNHNSIRRICPAMGTNIVLRSDLNYKSTINYPLCGKRHGSLSMRRIHIDPWRWDR